MRKKLLSHYLESICMLSGKKNKPKETESDDKQIFMSLQTMTNYPDQKKRNKTNWMAPNK